MDKIMKRWLNSSTGTSEIIDPEEIVQDVTSVSSNNESSNAECEEAEESTDSDVDILENNENQLTNKVTKKINFGKLSKVQWLQHPVFKNWLISQDEQLYCKFCNTRLLSKKSSLIQHSKTKIHLSNTEIQNFNKKIDWAVNKSKDPSRKNELRAALFIAVHNSIRTADHYISCVKDHSLIDKDFHIQRMTLNRTKCTAVINQVLGPYFRNALREEIGDNPFSAIIDESNDVSVNKYLGVVVKFNSAKTFNLITCFLGLVLLISCDATSIVTGIKELLTEYGLPLNQLKGIGTDNASVMVGINNGVHQKLLKECPGLILVPCICHSLQLAVSAAAKYTLPNNIEFIIAETFNWFSHSSIRQNNYQKIYQLINNGHDPKKIVRSCDTRWLSIYTAVKRITTQWIELKTHFGIAHLEEKCYKAKELYYMYQNESNLAYLLFLKFVLEQVSKVNYLFESNNTDVSKLLSDMVFLMNFLKQVIIPDDIPNFNILETPIEDKILLELPYLGYEAEEQVTKLCSDEKTRIRNDCKKFVLRLIFELRNRLPKNINILEKIDVFSAGKHKALLSKDQVAKLVLMYSPTNYCTIMQQYQNLKLIDWKNTNKTVEFWSEVNLFQDAQGLNPYKDLVHFVQSFLCLPFSNAEVERAFSAMNIIKSKLRNRMKPKLLNNLLIIKKWLKIKNKCCNDFEISDDLLDKYVNTNLYEEHLEDGTDEIFSLF